MGILEDLCKLEETVADYKRSPQLPLTHRQYQDFLRLMGLPENMQLTDLCKDLPGAYRKQCLKVHPDRHRDHQAQATAAFQVLTDICGILNEVIQQSRQVEMSCAQPTTSALYKSTRPPRHNPFRALARQLRTEATPLVNAVCERRYGFFRDNAESVLQKGMKAAVLDRYATAWDLNLQPGDFPSLAQVVKELQCDPAKPWPRMTVEDVLSGLWSHRVRDLLTREGIPLSSAPDADVSPSP
ncbi:MAG: hypothetical protein A3J38_03025 [Gammaproteobacteria bacterium RIFCSPHIGHO2_12_FULL_45_9]|nr:MAG: hypothetical protein A3J38_03025 [Gammaproteobacteria bacterium RIFCSPHIGHO2_12_FULL_45_9]